MTDAAPRTPEITRPDPNRPLGYLVPDSEFQHAEFVYTGPTAEVASLTESIYWPISDTTLEGDLIARGWTLDWTGRVETPYGLGPTMRLWLTAEGRRVLWVRDYGRTAGGEYRERQLGERLFWILGKAGVRTVLAGVHSGIADWRPADQQVVPGDLVIPWTFESKAWFTGLPGTRYETTMNNPAVVDTRQIPWPFFDEPLAARAGAHFLEVAQPLVDDGFVRRTWTADQVRAVIVDMDHIGFETHFDVFSRLVTCKAISELQPDRPPVVTLHGAVVNPVLAALMRIELLQYQFISNPAPGMTATIKDVHDETVYDADGARRWLGVEAAFLESYAPVPEV